MPQRSFVVRVSENSPRVVVEDVRTREKAVADSLEGIGVHIERWLGADAEEEAAPPAVEEDDATASESTPR